MREDPGGVRGARVVAVHGGHADAVEWVATLRAPGDLTAREVEVVRLIAVGLSNLGIAARLAVTERAVATTHVEHLLGKLGARSLVQIGDLAAEQGLGPGAAESAAPDAP
jgi:DNA-binding NarL/FixJ family response regulator